MAALLFITLNIADTYLTKVGLLMGATEINPIVAYCGSSLIVRGLIVVAIIMGLYWFNREKSLWWMNIIVFAVVLWNFVQCAILHINGAPWSII